MADKLHILWANADPLTSELMVLMYATNSMVHGFWEHVHLIIWGATAKLLCESPLLREKLKLFQAAGGEVSACRACAEKLNLLSELEKIGGINIIYIGTRFTDIIKGDEKLITV